MVGGNFRKKVAPVFYNCHSLTFFVILNPATLNFYAEPLGGTAPRFSGDMQHLGFMRIGMKGATFGLICPAQSYPPANFQ